jgi:hypothetical protein
MLLGFASASAVQHMCGVKSARIGRHARMAAVGCGGCWQAVVSTMSKLHKGPEQSLGNTDAAGSRVCNPWSDKLFYAAPFFAVLCSWELSHM